MRRLKLQRTVHKTQLVICEEMWTEEFRFAFSTGLCYKLYNNNYTGLERTSGLQEAPRMSRQSGQKSVTGYH